MSRRAQWLVIAAAVAALGGGFWTSVHLFGDRFSQVGAGTAAPDFHARAVDGSGRVRGIADYRGQVVLLNLWATWCAPCVIEMPSIQRLYDRYRSAGLKVVGVSVDDPEFEPRILEFVAEHHLTFEILHEGSGTIESDYQSAGIPSTYLIGRDGRIRKLHLGASDWDSPPNRALVASLLGVTVDGGIAGGAAR